MAHAQAQLELMHASAARDIAYVALYKALGGAPDTVPDARGHAPAQTTRETAR